MKKHIIVFDLDGTLSIVGELGYTCLQVADGDY